MQSMVNHVRETEKPDLVVVISHNGMDVDLKMASRVSGIDVIFGGHTHDGVPRPVEVSNKGGKTLVTNAGSTASFLLSWTGCAQGQTQGLPLPTGTRVLQYARSRQGNADLYRKVRAPYKDKLEKKLAVAGETLYRRGNFNGTFDQIICDALNKVNDAQISLSPGFRWGTTVLPGQDITMDHVMDQTCITYPETYRREMTGEEIKAILEDVADNLFNTDPYYQQGGDMVRVGGLDYVCEPGQTMGKRVTNMTLDNGTKIEANKKYMVSGWATVGSKSPGRPIWDVVADYLKEQGTVKIKKLNTPKLVGVKGNPGIAS